MKPKPSPALHDLSPDRVRCLGCQTQYTLPRGGGRATGAEAALGCPECGCISWIGASYALQQPRATYAEQRPRPL